jgi:hypothetical protein
MASLESHGHSSGHADAETPLAPEIGAGPGGPLPAAAPVLVQRERIRGADGNSVTRFAVRFPPDAPLPPELHDLPRYEATWEGPWLDLGMGITVTLLAALLMVVAVSQGSLGWAGVVFALLVLALVIGSRRAARLVPSSDGRIVLLDELPENVAMSPLQRFTARRSEVTFDVFFPMIALAGLSDLSGVLWAVGVGGAFLSSLLEWLAGPVPDEEEHSPRMDAQRDLRRRLRLASRVVLIGPVVGYGVLLHDLEKGMPRWMTVLFGTVAAVLTVRKFLENDDGVGTEPGDPALPASPPGPAERSSPTAVRHGFERFRELADPARPLSPEDFGASAPEPPSREPVPQLGSPGGSG